MFLSKIAGVLMVITLPVGAAVWAKAEPLQRAWTKTPVVMSVANSRRMIASSCVLIEIADPLRAGTSRRIGLARNER